MRIKFEVTDASGKAHKRSSTSLCLLALRRDPLRRDPPSKLWPKGVAACSHAEWVGKLCDGRTQSQSWRKEPSVDAIEVLEARQV